MQDCSIWGNDIRKVTESLFLNILNFLHVYIGQDKSFSEDACCLFSICCIVLQENILSLYLSCLYLCPIHWHWVEVYYYALEKSSLFELYMPRTHTLFISCYADVQCFVLQKSSGGVLLPKSAVKFERYLMGEVSKTLMLPWEAWGTDFLL